MNEWIETLLGFPTTDWESLVKDKQLVRSSFAFDSTPTSDAWGGLLDFVRKELPKYSVSSWEGKLFILKQGITGQSYDANFNDDFDAFVYFAYSSLNQQKKAPKFPINALLQPRTQELYKYLLKCRYQELLQKQNIDELLRHSDELNALALLFPASSDYQENTLPHNFATIFIKTITDWLKMVIGYLKERLTSPPETAFHYQYARMANILWDLATKFQLHDFISEQETQETLSRAYNQTVDGIKNLPTPTIQHFLLTNNKNVSTYFGFRKMISSLDAAIDADWDSLNYWGASLHRQAALTFIKDGKNERKGLEEYLAAYEQSNSYIENLSARLYAYRGDLEEKLRANTGLYCVCLEMLDTEMEKIEKKLVNLQRSWLREVEVLVPFTTLHQASQCIGQLLTPEFRSLNFIAWAEHTVYCSSRTEAKIAFEMEKKNQFPKYNLETTLTQSDFLISHFWHKCYRQARSILSKVHPDKFRSDPNLGFIADYCTQQIVSLRERADKTKRLWNYSQWCDISRRTDDDMLHENERLTQERIDSVDIASISDFALEQKIEVASGPKTPLTLNLLAFHKEYLSWVSQERSQNSSLEKKTMRVEAYYSLYGNGIDDPVEIEINNLYKQKYPANRRERNYQDKKLVEIQEKSNTAISKIKKINEGLYESSFNYAKVIIDEELEREGTLPAREVIQNLRPLLSKKLSFVFGLTSEEIAERIDFCLKSYGLNEPETTAASSNTTTPDLPVELITEDAKALSFVETPRNVLAVTQAQSSELDVSRNMHGFFASAAIGASVALIMFSI